MYQDVYCQKSGWDNPLEDEVKQLVESWIKSLVDCQTITIHRCVWDHLPEELLHCSLHGFVDARKKAYYAVISLGPVVQRVDRAIKRINTTKAYWVI